METKKAVIGGVVAVSVICISACGGSHKPSPYANTDEFAVAEEVIADEAYEEAVAYDYDETDYNGDPSTLLLSVESDEEDKTDTQYGDWKKHYFQDEFGELDYSNPFISKWVKGNTFNVNLGIAYRPSGSFTFKLFDNDGDVRDIYNSQIDMSIRVNGHDIGPVTMDVRNNEFYVTGDDTRAMSTIFNQGTFTISLRYNSYGEEYHYVFNVTGAKGTFSRAVPHLLGSTYYGE